MQVGDVIQIKVKVIEVIGASNGIKYRVGPASSKDNWETMRVSDQDVVDDVMGAVMWSDEQEQAFRDRHRD